MLDSEITCIFGRRRAGKSTKAKELLKERDRVVVLDPCDEYAPDMRFRRLRTIGGVRACMRANWRKGFKIAYVPDGNEAAAAEELAALVWAAQAPFEHRAGPELLLVLEEAGDSCPQDGRRHKRPALGRCIRRGRHRHIAIMAIAQGPALVDATLRRNAAETYYFALEFDADRAAVQKLFGRDTANEIAMLEDHHFLHVERGRVARGTNHFAKKRRKQALNNSKKSR